MSLQGARPNWYVNLIITGQTIMFNLAGKTNQYAQFIYRLAETFVVSREDELHGDDCVLGRINIFHLFT